MTILRYGNTNTVFLKSGLLIDTDYAGTLQGFYRAIKANGIRVSDIKYVLATHYHPDHIGLISELMKQGVQLLLTDVQLEYVHYSDRIFARDGIPYEPIDETKAVIISFEDSRKFLNGIGISGEIISTPSHSPDSISVILDDSCCIVGDLEPVEYLKAYENNQALQAD
ncbi:MAG: MBL fold metallo-hydrolase [Oscillospiraceae bacterium]|nr:MBL fold metallo-hydrolase [Oscillospiraceae bacterium]